MRGARYNMLLSCVYLYSLPDSSSLSSVTNIRQRSFCTRQNLYWVLHSANILSTKSSLSIIFFEQCRKTLGKKTHIYSLGKVFTKFYTRQKTLNNPPPLTYPSFYHFSSFLIFKSNLCVLRMVRFELATPRARITSSTTTILYQLCLYYIFIPRIL